MKKKLKNSNFDKTQILTNSKAQIVKLRNSSCEKTKRKTIADKTQQLKVSKTKKKNSY